MRWSELGVGLFVHLGNKEIELPEPTDSEVGRALYQAISTFDQRVVSEEDAAVALAAFESLTVEATRFPGVHLCIAEVFLSGAAPQHGKDASRAFDALVSFLRNGGACCHQEGHSAVLSVLDRVSKSVPSTCLSSHAENLTSLANLIPDLRGTALRASLAKLSCIQGAACNELVPADEADRRQQPADLLESVLSSCKTLQEEVYFAQYQLREEQEQRARLESALQIEREKQACLEHLQNENQVLARALALEEQRVISLSSVQIESDMLRGKLEDRDALVEELYGKLKQQSEAKYVAECKQSHLDKDMGQFRRHAMEGRLGDAVDRILLTARGAAHEENSFSSRILQSARGPSREENLLNSRRQSRHPSLTKFSRPASAFNDEEAQIFRSVGQQLFTPRPPAY